VLLSLFLASRCLAQTSVAKPLPPPAIEGAYDHDPVRQQGTTPQSASGVGKPASTQDLSTSPLDIRRVAMALAIVLGLVFVCRWAARWMFPSAGVGRSSQVMKVLSRSVIAPKQQLLLIQVGRRLVLVGDCGQQMNALAEISDPDEVAGLLGQLRAGLPGEIGSETDNASNKPFGPLLGRAQRQFDDVPVPAEADPEENDDAVVTAGVDETRDQLSGLTDKIRMLSRQLGKM
jgi:flagellar protein FliO/FliZ